MQQVNFYQDEFKPEVIIYNARQMLLVTVIFTALVLLYHFSSAHELNEQRNLLAQEQQQLNDKQQHINTLKQDILQYGEQPLMQAKLSGLQQQLTQQKAIFDHLANDNLTPQSGFSATLESLSERHIKQVWLNNFSLRHGGKSMTIQGMSHSTALIPEYIDSLAQSPVFKGQQFSVFQMSNPNNTETYEFELHTQDESQP